VSLSEELIVVVKVAGDREEKRQCNSKVKVYIAGQE
jgi:hypothetical protein